VEEIDKEQEHLSALSSLMTDETILQVMNNPEDNWLMKASHQDLEVFGPRLHED
jgi:hypothetical protein